MTNETETLTEGALKVWWIPQVPMKAFEFLVKDMVEGKKIMEVLADYDTFQFENNIKPDYSNMGGLVRLETLVGQETESDIAHNRRSMIPAPNGLAWYDIEASELWEEWEALNGEA